MNTMKMDVQEHLESQSDETIPAMLSSSLVMERKRSGEDALLKIKLPTGKGLPTYQIKVLSENPISGLLPFEASFMDEQPVFSYIITSFLPADIILKRQVLSKQQLLSLLDGLVDTLQRAGDYLLDTESVWLSHQQTWMMVGEPKLRFAYVPGVSFGETNAMVQTMLRELLLHHINLDDQDGVGHRLLKCLSTDTFHWSEIRLFTRSEHVRIPDESNRAADRATDNQEEHPSVSAITTQGSAYHNVKQKNRKPMQKRSVISDAISIERVAPAPLRRRDTICIPDPLSNHSSKARLTINSYKKSGTKQKVASNLETGTKQAVKKKIETNPKQTAMVTPNGRSAREALCLLSDWIMTKMEQVHRYCMKQDESTPQDDLISRILKARETSQENQNDRIPREYETFGLGNRVICSSADCEERKPHIHQESMEETVWLGSRKTGSAKEPTLIHQLPDGTNVHHVLADFPFLIGRSAIHADLSIENPAVGKLHAEIRWETKSGSDSDSDTDHSNFTAMENLLQGKPSWPSELRVYDLNSRNGTLVDGEPVHQMNGALLKDGALLMIANELFRISL